MSDWAACDDRWSAVAQQWQAEHCRCLTQLDLSPTLPDSLFFFVLGALIFSAFIKGSLGMGFSTICLAILANVIELKTAISIVVIPSLISNIMVMISAGNWRISIQTFWTETFAMNLFFSKTRRNRAQKRSLLSVNDDLSTFSTLYLGKRGLLQRSRTMLIMAAPGMVLGLQILRQESNSFSLSILSIVLISYGLWGLRNSDFRLDNKYIPRLNPVIGLLTGTINGATGSQIFPIMPYLLSLPISKEVVVQTINLSFTLCSLIMLLGLLTIDALDHSSMLTYSLGIIPVMAGVTLGNRVRQRLSDQRFRQSVMILVIALGALLLLK